jgi:hypothetical protein
MSGRHDVVKCPERKLARRKSNRVIESGKSYVVQDETGRLIKLRSWAKKMTPIGCGEQ